MELNERQIDAAIGKALEDGDIPVGGYMTVVSGNQVAVAVLVHRTQDIDRARELVTGAIPRSMRKGAKININPVR